MPTPTARQPQAAWAVQHRVCPTQAGQVAALHWLLMAKQVPPAGPVGRLQPHPP